MIYSQGRATILINEFGEVKNRWRLETFFFT